LGKWKTVLKFYNFNRYTTKNFSWSPVVDALVSEKTAGTTSRNRVAFPEVMRYRKPVFAIDYHAVEISRTMAGAHRQRAKVSNIIF
jgi:hypothetical protein